MGGGVSAPSTYVSACLEEDRSHHMGASKSRPSPAAGAPARSASCPSRCLLPGSGRGPSTSHAGSQLVHRILATRLQQAAGTL